MRKHLGCAVVWGCEGFLNIIFSASVTSKPSRKKSTVAVEVRFCNNIDALAKMQTKT